VDSITANIQDKNNCEMLSRNSVNLLSTAPSVTRNQGVPRGLPGLMTCQSKEVAVISLGRTL
jgi:hypothetical protein